MLRGVMFDQPQQHHMYTPYVCEIKNNTVTGMIKLALAAGKANPAPPVGPALGAKVCRCCVYGVFLSLLL